MAAERAHSRAQAPGPNATSASPPTGAHLPGRAPEFVADELSIPIEMVRAIFDDLEKHMTFICRNDEGMAVWAYPVTVEKTPHRLTFSTGEQIYAA